MPCFSFVLVNHLSGTATYVCAKLVCFSTVTVEAVMAAPTSAERKACWHVKDQLWQCLDDNNDQIQPCQKLQSEFEAKCPAQWVKCGFSVCSGCKRTFKLRNVFPVSALNDCSTSCCSLAGEVFHQAERLPEIQREDGDRRLHPC